MPQNLFGVEVPRRPRGPLVPPLVDELQAEDLAQGDQPPMPMPWARGGAGDSRSQGMGSGLLDFMQSNAPDAYVPRRGDLEIPITGIVGQPGPRVPSLPGLPAQVGTGAVPAPASLPSLGSPWGGITVGRGAFGGMLDSPGGVRVSERAVPSAQAFANYVQAPQAVPSAQAFANYVQAPQPAARPEPPPDFASFVRSAFGGMIGPESLTDQQRGALMTAYVPFFRSHQESANQREFELGGGAGGGGGRQGISRAEIAQRDRTAQLHESGQQHRADMQYGPGITARKAQLDAWNTALASRIQAGATHEQAVAALRTGGMPVPELLGGPALSTSSGPSLTSSGPSLVGNGPPMGGNGPSLTRTGPPVGGSGPPMVGNGPPVVGNGPPVNVNQNQNQNGVYGPLTEGGPGEPRFSNIDNIMVEATGQRRDPVTRILSGTRQGVGATLHNLEVSRPGFFVSRSGDVLAWLERNFGPQEVAAARQGSTPWEQNSGPLAGFGALGTGIRQMTSGHNAEDLGREMLRRFYQAQRPAVDPTRDGYDRPMPAASAPTNTLPSFTPSRRPPLPWGTITRNNTP